MQVLATAITEVKIIVPKVFQDERGYFLETWQHARFKELVAPVDFVQDNLSHSVKGTLRGLHWQEEQPQDKLVSVIQGEIFDVAVDIRKDSPTYGKWVAEVLSADNHKQMFIPKGFAHGFYVLSDTAIVHYKCSDYYHQVSERVIRWDSPGLAIGWPLSAQPLLSRKDARAAHFEFLCGR